jgi:uncharacterized protein involved in outer membrane biogenesis
MRFKVPFLGYALAGIAFLLPSILLTAFLPFLINAQPIRAKLMREIGSWAGGEAKVAGSISVRDFFSLSVEAQNVEIGRFKGAAPIEGMRAERVVARIAWFNLLLGNFNFDKIKISNAVITVRANGPGDAVKLLSDLISTPRDTPFDAFYLEKALVALRKDARKPYRRLEVRSALAYTSKSGHRLNTSAHVVWKNRFAGVTMRSAFRASPASRLPWRIAFDSDLLTASFDGEAALTGPADAEGVLNFRSPDPVAASDWLEVDIGPGAIARPVSASGDFTLFPDQMTLTSAEISIGDQTAKAALTLKRGKDVPRLEGVLAFEHLDAAALLPARDESAPKLPAAPFRIPIESDLRISSKTASWSGIEAGPLALAVASRPERLTAEVAELGFLGGDVRGHIALDMTGALPRATARLTGESLDAAAVLRLVKQQDWLSGEADINVEAETNFDDPSQIADQMIARARVNFPEGGQMRLDIPRLATSVLGETTGWDALDLTSAAFDRLRFDMTLREGQISFANVALATAGRQLNGRGEIDLAGRSLDWRFNFLPTEELARDVPTTHGKDANAAGPQLSIKGPWARPTIHRDSGPSSMLQGGDHAAGLELSVSRR